MEKKTYKYINLDITIFISKTYQNVIAYNCSFLRSFYDTDVVGDWTGWRNSEVKTASAYSSQTSWNSAATSASASAISSSARLRKTREKGYNLTALTAQFMLKKLSLKGEVYSF